MRVNSILFCLTLLPFIACQDDDVPPSTLGTYELVEAFPELSFNRPVDFQHQGERVFVVEQAGIISTFENTESAPSKKTFLDIRNQVNDSGNEEGLLGLAFHPDYNTNGFFFVNYTATNPARTVISRFEVSSTNPDAANTGSELVILEFPQPFSNHNGGQLSFGPDEFLYIASGDGGSGNDPQGNGQKLTTLLGKILRIDVNTQAGGKNYAIPADNPFVNNAAGNREEIFAYGLRNPWRFSFDAENGQIWAGDVGQNAFEEIDIIVKGGNYGWAIMEASQCVETDCDATGLTLPVWEYGRSEGISVTGGFVYRGSIFPEFIGKYIYGDFGSGKIWALDNADQNNPVNTELVDSDLNISSFGVDAGNELYICSFDGNIYKLEKTSD